MFKSQYPVLHMSMRRGLKGPKPKSLLTPVLRQIDMSV